MKALNIVTLASVLTTLPLAATADVPNIFVAGEAASAAEVNQNFSALEQRISDLEAQAGTNLSMDSLSGDYRLQLSGGLWEFFYNADDPEVTEATAFRDFLVAGTMTLNSDGTMIYDLEDVLEPGIFLTQGGFFEDDTFGNSENVSGSWTLDSTNNIISVTLSDDPLTLDLHIARDQNSLLGSVFIRDTEFDEEFNEDIDIYEVINLNAIRLP